MHTRLRAPSRPARKIQKCHLGPSFPRSKPLFLEVRSTRKTLRNQRLDSHLLLSISTLDIKKDDAICGHASGVR